MQIEIETLYTPYTLDTYQTFTSDSTEEMIIDYMSEDVKKDLNYDDIKWKYDWKPYKAALASNLVLLLNNHIVDDVILKIEQTSKVFSPREYNFITDWCMLTFTVNEENLRAYIAANKKDFNENKIQNKPGFVWLGDKPQEMINYYLATVSAQLYKPFTYMVNQLEEVDQYEFIHATITT